MNQIQAILTIDTDNLPENFQEILKEEQAVVAAWKAEGFLSHLYLREAKNGAVLQFNGLTVEQVKEKMASLPFYKISTHIEYYSLIQQF
jgi:muconolactone D-isomerase